MIFENFVIIFLGQSFKLYKVDCFEGKESIDSEYSILDKPINE